MAKIQLTATSAQVATLKGVAAKGNMSLSSLVLSSLALSLQDKSLLPANTPGTRPTRGTRKARAQGAQEHHTATSRATLIRKALRDREIEAILNGIVRK